MARAAHPLFQTAVTGTDLIDQVYREGWEDLCRYVERIFGGGPPDPEDAAQAAFTKFAGLEDVLSVRNPKAFLRRSAFNYVIDCKRRDRSRVRHAQALAAEYSDLRVDEPTPERRLLESERFAMLERALQRMPSKQRTVLTLYCFKGLTYTQIASATGWSYGDVYRQMSAALAYLSGAFR